MAGPCRPLHRRGRHHRRPTQRYATRQSHPHDGDGASRASAHRHHLRVPRLSRAPGRLELLAGNDSCTGGVSRMERLWKEPIMSWIMCSMRVIFGTVLVLVVSTASALADPPERVARISFIGGPVSFRPASLDEWSLASLNYPLTVGDHLWTDRGGRSELQLGSTVVRLAPSTAFSVLNLDDHTAQLRLAQGAISVRVRSLNDSDVIEIDTPNGVVSLLRAGLYRVDVNEAGDSSTVTVRQGEADVAVSGSAFPLRGEQSAVLTGAGGPGGIDAPQSAVRNAVGIDDFEDWCLTRDRRAENT